MGELEMAPSLAAPCMQEMVVECVRLLKSHGWTVARRFGHISWFGVETAVKRYGSASAAALVLDTELTDRMHQTAQSMLTATRNPLRKYP